MFSYEEFPSSYYELADSAKDKFAHYKTELFYQARAILSDYTKRDSFWSSLTLYFTHWYHHVDAVNQCLDHADHHQNFDFLYMAIKKIGNINPQGSLARRIRFIEFLWKNAEELNKKLLHPAPNNILSQPF